MTNLCTATMFLSAFITLTIITTFMLMTYKQNAGLQRAWEIIFAASTLIGLLTITSKIE